MVSSNPLSLIVQQEDMEMILKLPENRRVILEYLENIDEDTFIDEFVIPYFCSQGYQLYRQNSHGPGEHGKDLIFCRYLPMFFENEYVAVQAKAEKVTTANCSQFGHQMNRAYDTGFATRSGKERKLPHYAVFINSKKHTNDGNDELPQFIKNRHTIILSQENVCELIMQSGIAPKHVMDKLSQKTTSLEDSLDSDIYKIILGDEPSVIDKLLDHQLKYHKDKINRETKDMILDYIYDRWQQNYTWEGTVKPMKWFNKYFDFFTSKQGKYLLSVLSELTSTNPSYEALSDTLSITRQITPGLLTEVEGEFIHQCAQAKLGYRKNYAEYLIQLLTAYSEQGDFQSSRYRKICETILDIEKEKRKKQRKTLMDELFKLVHPGLSTDAEPLCEPSP